MPYTYGPESADGVGSEVAARWAASHPWWSGRKLGQILHQEADWPALAIGKKYGIAGAGTPAIARDTDRFFGGAASAALTTSAGATDTCECRLRMARANGGLIAFEQRFVPDVTVAGAHFEFGVRANRSVTCRGTMRYVVNGAGGSGQWYYEETSGVFVAISGALSPEPGLNPSIGDLWGWARLLIDAERRRYVSFEAHSEGEAPILHIFPQTPLVTPAGASTGSLETFARFRNASAAARTSYTTDWLTTVLE